MTKQTKQVKLSKELKKRLWETEHHFKPGVNERMYRHSDVEKLLAQAQQEDMEKELKSEVIEFLEWEIDDEPCSYDHHGFCQTHYGGTDENPTFCREKWAKKLLEALQKEAEGQHESGRSE